MAQRNYSYDTYQPNRNTRAVIPKRDAAPVTVGQWIGIFILTIIPLVNLVCIIVWSFQKLISPSKKNYARAVLTLVIITILLFIAVALVMMFAFNIDLVTWLNSIIPK